MRGSIPETVETWISEGRQVTLATVADAKRSAPQPIGTKMAVNSAGQVSGSVSGGCVEGAVVEAAEQIMAGAPAQLLRYGIADEEAWDVGLPCGGEIAVWVENYRPDGLQAEFFRAAREDRRAVLITCVPGEPADGMGPRSDSRLLLLTDGDVRGTLGSPDLDAAACDLGRDALWSETSELIEVPGFHTQLFIEVVAPAPKLIIVGAVDIAAQLATTARLAGWCPYVVDPRARFATPERFPDAQRVIAAWPQEAFPQIGEIDRATAIAVLTHDPKLDDAALGMALASDAAYIGAMGSRRAQERRRARLQEAGFNDADLSRIAAPIGLDLGALSAGETALSIMSEIVALRHHRSGGRLVDAGGRIHAATR